MRLNFEFTRLKFKDTHIMFKLINFLKYILHIKIYYLFNFNLMKIIFNYIIYSIKIILLSGISLIIFINYYCYIFFIPIILISSLLIFISNSWFSIWIIIEINLISFISLLVFDKNIKNDLIINYFLIQSFNSYIFILSILNLNTNLYNIIILILYLSIISKIGLPPFYIWYIKIIKNLNWINLYILSTLQKLIPLIVLNNILNYIYINYFFIYLIFIRLYGSIKGLNQNNLKIILTYSSIIQISWIIMLIINREIIILNYFIIYTFINLNLSILFFKFNINNLNNLINLKINNKNNFYFIILIIFSLSRIPPIFGFIIKLISIQFMFKFINFFLISLIIINSLVRINFYLKIIFSSIINYSLTNKFNYKIINFKNKFNLKFSLYSIIIFLILIFYEII